MDLVLRRIHSESDGILGVLYSSDVHGFRCDTLEHAYRAPSGDFVPKLPPGFYACRRGMHKLEHMHVPFETFEVTDVPGHTGILFHVGNFNKDSDGCILLGECDQRAPNLVLLHSKDTFNKFMAAQHSMHEFLLTVLGSDMPMV